jgi:protein SCO1/2
VLFAALGYGAFSLGRALRRAPELAGTPLQRPVAVGDVSLVNASGDVVRLSDFQAPVKLIFFGFTRCPDVCPLTMSRLANIYRDLGEPEALQVIMITVDPAFDTPEVIQRYAAAFHPSFVGLSGSNSDVARAAQTFFVGYQSIDEANFTHTDAVFVVDAANRFHRIYNQSNLRYLAADLAVLLAN